MIRDAIAGLVLVTVGVANSAAACQPYWINGQLTYLAYSGAQCTDQSCCGQGRTDYALPELGAIQNGDLIVRRLDELIETQPYGKLPNSPFDSAIVRVSRLNGLDPLLVKALIRVESNFNPYAVSNKGAGGLMQLMPATARRYGTINRFDPDANLRAGTRHLRELLTRLKDLDLALAAYNAGEGAVKKYGGIPPFSETQRYVAAVKGYYQRALQERDRNS